MSKAHWRAVSDKETPQLSLCKKIWVLQRLFDCRIVGRGTQASDPYLLLGSESDPTIRHQVHPGGPIV